MNTHLPSFRGHRGLVTSVCAALERLSPRLSVEGYCSELRRPMQGGLFGLLLGGLLLGGLLLGGMTGCAAFGVGGAPSTSLPAGTRTMPTPSQSSAYVIGAEDVVQISVWKHDELSQEQTVRTDGRIALKLVGEVPAAGMTLQTLRQLLTEKYRDFVPEAEVSVSLKEMNSFRVYVLGRVSKPGEFRVQSQLTVLQALALAGGFTPYADERNVRIVRRVGGQDVLVPFNFQAVMRGQAGDLPLEPGDRILVP